MFRKIRQRGAHGCAKAWFPDAPSRDVQRCLQGLYPADKGIARHAEAFEICEYDRPIEDTDGDEQEKQKDDLPAQASHRLGRGHDLRVGVGHRWVVRMRGQYKA